MTKSLTESRSRDFCQIFEGFGFGFGKFGLGFGFGKFGLGRKVSVSVSEKFGLGKKYRFRKKVSVSEKSFGFGKFGWKSLGISFGQNFGIIIQWW